jgi:hypothetical protein
MTKVVQQIPLIVSKPWQIPLSLSSVYPGDETADSTYSEIFPLDRVLRLNHLTSWFYIIGKPEESYII